MDQEIDFEDELLDFEGGAKESPLSGTTTGISNDRGQLAEAPKDDVDRTDGKDGKGQQSRRQELHGSTFLGQIKARKRNSYGEENLDADPKTRSLPTPSTVTATNERESNDWPGVVENKEGQRVLKRSHGTSERGRSSEAFHAHGSRVEVQQEVRGRAIEGKAGSPGALDHATPKGHDRGDKWTNGEQTRGGSATGDRRLEWQEVRHSRGEEQREDVGGRRQDWNNPYEGGSARGGPADGRQVARGVVDRLEVEVTQRQQQLREAVARTRELETKVRYRGTSTTGVREACGW